MFSLNDTMRYFLCPGRTDMRKGISSLCGLVHGRMRSEVRNGDVFIFARSSSYPMEWRDQVMMVEGIQENPGQRLLRLRAQRKECHV